MKRGIELPEPLAGTFTVDQLLSADSRSLKSGIYKTTGTGLPIFLKWRNAGSETTFVSFAASVSTKVKNVPVFSGKNATGDLDANVLMISDPSLMMDDQIFIAWYAGNQAQPDLQATLNQIITAFQGGGRIVLFGPSGGGFAALHHAARLENSTAIVANPVVDIKKRGTFPRYLTRAWDYNTADELPESVHTSVVEDYEKPLGTQVVYIQNPGDESFLKAQWWPFLAAAHEENRIFYLTPYLGRGHVAPDTYSFRRLFPAVVDNENWDDLKSAVSSVYVESSVTPSQQKVSDWPLLRA